MLCRMLFCEQPAACQLTGESLTSSTDVAHTADILQLPLHIAALQLLTPSLLNTVIRHLL
jgi:hypothetical protein